MIIVTKPKIKIIKNEKYEDDNLNLQHLEIVI
jgi:hypothetical protein